MLPSLPACSFSLWTSSLCARLYNRPPSSVLAPLLLILPRNCSRAWELFPSESVTTCAQEMMARPGIYHEPRLLHHLSPPKLGSVTIPRQYRAHLPSPGALSACPTKADDPRLHSPPSEPDRSSERTGPPGAEQGVMGKERDEGERRRGRGVSPAGMGIWETSSLKCIANMKKLLGVVGPECPVCCGQWILFSLLRVACVAVGEIWVWLKLFFLLPGCLEPLLPSDDWGTQCSCWLI